MNARDEAVEMIRRICPPHLSADEYGRILAEKFDAYRVEVLIKAGVKYEDCPVCRAAHSVGEPCGNCAFKARIAAELDKKAPTPAATKPEFFQPGHTYSREHHGHRIEFLVEHVATAPSGRYRIAFGWKNAFGWPEEPFDSDDLTGWTDVTEGGDSR